MTSDKTQLDEDDFPLEARDNTLTTKTGELIATAQSAGLADDLARRLNEDAARRHEGKWSA